MNHNKTINVIDSIMGSGKSTFLITKLKTEYTQRLFANNHANGWTQVSDNSSPHYSQSQGGLCQIQLPVPKYLVVVPLLSEVKRFTEALPELEFENPTPIEGSKFWHLKTLVKDGRNIVTTHSLFTMLDREIYHEIQKQGYTLIIDECLDAVSMFTGITDSDKKLILETGMVLIDPKTKRLIWNYSKYPNYGAKSDKFNDIKKLCDIGSLVMVNGAVLLWQFPSEFLSAFTEVWVATYLYYGSPFSAYLEAEGFKVNRFYIRGGQESYSTNEAPNIMPYDETDKNKVSSQGDKEIRKALSMLVDVYEGSANDIGDDDYSLSSGWYKRATEAKLGRLQDNLYNFFFNYAKTKPVKKQDPKLNSRGQLQSPGKTISVPSNGWTSFSDYRDDLKGKGYTKGWIANNTKATNEFAHMASMAYTCNWFVHPFVKSYFKDLGIEVNEDAHALSALIQWLWRSQIRDNKPIKVYIPSRRMRKLLTDWLNGVDLVQRSAQPLGVQRQATQQTALAA